MECRAPGGTVDRRLPGAAFRRGVDPAAVDRARPDQHAHPDRALVRWDRPSRDLAPPGGDYRAGPAAAAHAAVVQSRQLDGRQCVRGDRCEWARGARGVGDPPALAIDRTHAGAGDRGRAARHARRARGQPAPGRLRAMADGASHDGVVRRRGLPPRPARRDGLHRLSSAALELCRGRRDRADVLRLPRAARALLRRASRLSGARCPNDRRGPGRDRAAPARHRHQVRGRTVRDGLHRGQGRVASPPVHHLQRPERADRPDHRQGAR